MTLGEIDCFRCNARIYQPIEAPWDWSTPRGLCPSHKLGLELQDGQSLDSILTQLDRREGSLLGWIFNPVYFKVGGNRKITAWTDFVAGGMAVFEDRFFARDHFAFRALERARSTDVLYALRLAIFAGAPTSTVNDLRGAILEAEQTRPGYSSISSHEQHDELRDLIRAWNFGLRLATIRDSLDRLWPRSASELDDWIDECHPFDDELQPHAVAPFLRELGELTLRRFPAIGSR